MTSKGWSPPRTTARIQGAQPRGTPPYSGTAYLRALAKAAESRAAQREAANASLRTGEVAEAIAAYRSAWKASPLDATLPSNLAEAMLRDGDVAGARTHALISLALIENGASPTAFQDHAPRMDGADVNARCHTLI